MVEAKIGQQDISKLSPRTGELLDESVVVDNDEKFSEPEHCAAYQKVQTGKTRDLMKISFEKLKEDFQHATQKNSEIAELLAFIEHKMEQMLQQNAARADFSRRLEQIIDTHNAGNSSAANSYG